MRLYEVNEVARWFPGSQTHARQRVRYLCRKRVLISLYVGLSLRVMPPVRIIGKDPPGITGRNPLGATDDQLQAWAPFAEEYFADLPVQLTPTEVARALCVPKEAIPPLHLPFYSPNKDEEVLLLRTDFVNYINSRKAEPF